MVSSAEQIGAKKKPAQGGLGGFVGDVTMRECAYLVRISNGRRAVILLPAGANPDDYIVGRRAPLWRLAMRALALGAGCGAALLLWMWGAGFGPPTRGELWMMLVSLVALVVLYDNNRPVFSQRWSPGGKLGDLLVQKEVVQEFDGPGYPGEQETD